MVVDLFRTSGKASSLTPDNGAVMEEVVNPMARFDGDWETSYVADYQRDDRMARKDKGGAQKKVYDTGLSNGDAPWDKVW